MVMKELCEDDAFHCIPEIDVADYSNSYA